MLSKPRLTLVLRAICLFGLIGSAQAAGPMTGQVGLIVNLGSGNGTQGQGDFRVYFQGQPVICNGTPWAYVNTTDYNYQAIVSNILTARSNGLPITIYWVQTSVGCEISQVEW